MDIIYIVIVILIIVAVVSLIVRRVRNRDESPTVDTRIITQIYGNAAVPDMSGNIEESLKSQSMLDEVIAAVQDIFAEICGEEALCTDEQKDSDAGSFVLKYQIPGQPAPLVFACEHLGTFDLYFKYTDSQLTESEQERLSGQYDHTMDKDAIRNAIRQMTGKG